MNKKNSHQIKILLHLGKECSCTKCSFWDNEFERRVGAYLLYIHFVHAYNQSPFPYQDQLKQLMKNHKFSKILVLKYFFQTWTNIMNFKVHNRSNFTNYWCICCFASICVRAFRHLKNKTKLNWRKIQFFDIWKLFRI